MIWAWIIGGLVYLAIAGFLLAIFQDSQERKTNQEKARLERERWTL